MVILISCLIFVAVMMVISLTGLKVYVRPKEAMDRVAGNATGSSDSAPIHPSLALHDLVKRLGNLVPASPKEASTMQRRLIRAGLRNPQALKFLFGAKVIFGILLPLIAGLLLARSSADPNNQLMVVLAAAAVGFFGPNEFVRLAGKRRQKGVHRGLANALDLLVVCVESGLGIDQAIIQAAKELEHAHPEVSEEFTLVSLELKAGKRRVEALRNLADRTTVEDLKKLVAVLIQADRFGTGVAQSLRAHADYMRVQARQIAEEKAAKLGVKLVFPIFFCILPSLFVVTVGPVVMKILRELLPMMNNM